MKKITLISAAFLLAGIPLAFAQSSLSVPVPQNAAIPPFPGDALQTREGNVQGRMGPATENEFLKLRQEFRSESGDLRNEYLDAKNMMRQGAVEVRNEVRNAAQDEMMRIREEARNEIGAVRSETMMATEEIRKDALPMQEGGTAFVKARTEALEMAKRIREEAMVKVEALKAESLDVIKQKREEFVGMIEAERKEFKERFEAQRAEFETKVQERRAELEANVERIRDEKKREALIRVDENLNDLSKRMLERFSSALEQIERVLANIVTRADKADAGGQDVSAVRTAVENAKMAISSARSSIEAQAPKVYSFSINTEETLRSDVAAARDALKGDLQIVKNAVDAARTATHAAATALAQIPNVDGYDFDTAASEAVENTTQSQ